MYISGGFNVYPAEVEQALARLDGVADVAVVGVPDERMGEVGKAYVVGRRTRPSPRTTSSPSPRSGWPTSRCRARSRSSTRSPATCRARCSRPSSGTAPDGPDPLRVRAGLPGRGPRVARRPTCRPSRCRRWTPPRAGRATRSGRPSWPTARWSVVSWPRGVPRPRGLAGRVGDLRGGVLPRRCARPGLPERDLPARPDPLRPRDPGAAGPVPAVDGHRRADLGAVLVRARGRLRPGLAHARPPAATTSAAAGCSTARRPGRRERRSRTGGSGCSAPTPRRSGTAG